MSQSQQIARRTLQQFGVRKPPVPVERMAAGLNVRVEYSPLEDNISGFLFQKNGKLVIGVNNGHSENRQRFTIAHELGHLLLEHHGELFIDRKAWLFRDHKSQTGKYKHEIKANSFAAELLMPEEFVRKAVGTELLDDDLIEELAERFQVSTQAMSIRLATLGLV